MAYKCMFWGTKIVAYQTYKPFLGNDINSWLHFPDFIIHTHKPKQKPSFAKREKLKIETRGILLSFIIQYAFKWSTISWVLICFIYLFLW
jgi:hypothetical protein